MFWSMFKKRKILTNFINFSLIIYLSVKSNPQSIKFWVLFLHQKLNPKPISYFLKSLNFRKFGSLNRRIDSQESVLHFLCLIFPSLKWELSQKSHSLLGFELGRLTCRNPIRMETLNFAVFVFVLNPLHSKSSQEKPNKFNFVNSLQNKCFFIFLVGC